MAARAEGHKFPYPITLLDAKDAVNTEKTSERPVCTASRALTTCRTSEYSFSALGVSMRL